MKNSARRDCGTNRQSGFTLIEILIVLVIIAILAAILFPVFSKARERARQASCASNLQQIYMAVSLYKSDEKRYPGSLAVLLPQDAQLDETTTTGPSDTVDNSKGTGYLKSTGNLLCPDETRDIKVGMSSYGDVSTDITKTSDNADVTVDNDNMGRFVWNYWGYLDDGTTYLTSADAKTAIDTTNQNRLVNPDATTTTCTTAPCYDAQSNPIKASLSNRFAPPTTFITHCVNHRYSTSDYKGNDIYVAANNVKDARDIVLTLDGQVKTLNVATYKAAPQGWTR